jgi:SMI1 / KNR4 family (SUKH-1)
MTIIELLSMNQWIRHRPATDEELAKLAAAFKVQLPADYEQLLRESNGCSLEGFDTPLIVYSIGEVLALFREHDFYEEIPEVLFFGGDGGGTMYCYDLRAKNDHGTYDVVFVKEDAGTYDRIFFRSPSLTDVVTRIVNNEDLNTEIM